MVFANSFWSLSVREVRGKSRRETRDPEIDRRGLHLTK